MTDALTQSEREVFLKFNPGTGKSKGFKNLAEELNQVAQSEGREPRWNHASAAARWRRIKEIERIAPPVLDKLKLKVNEHEAEMREHTEKEVQRRVDQAASGQMPQWEPPQYDLNALRKPAKLKEAAEAVCAKIAEPTIQDAHSKAERALSAFESSKSDIDKENVAVSGKELLQLVSDAIADVIGTHVPKPKPRSPRAFKNRNLATLMTAKRKLQDLVKKITSQQVNTLQLLDTAIAEIEFPKKYYNRPHSPVTSDAMQAAVKRAINKISEEISDSAAKLRSHLRTSVIRAARARFYRSRKQEMRRVIELQSRHELRHKKEEVELAEKEKMLKERERLLQQATASEADPIAQLCKHLDQRQKERVEDAMRRAPTLAAHDLMKPFEEEVIRREVQQAKKRTAVIDGDFPIELLTAIFACDEEKGQDEEVQAIAAHSSPVSRASAAVVLATMYTCWWKSAVMPEKAKVHATTLVLKPGRPEADLQNWRKISMAPTFAALYHRLIRERLCEAVMEKEVLPAEMKGFMPGIDGCQETIFIARSVAQHIHRTKEEVYVVLADLRCAFDQIVASRLEQELSALGIQEAARQAIVSIMEDIATVIRAQDGKTEKIDWDGHIIQGSPLTPLLFNLYLCRVVRALKAAFGGIPVRRTNSPQTPLHVFGTLVADDSIIYAKSAEEAQQLLYAFAAAVGALNIEVNAQKTTVVIPATVETAPPFKLAADQPVSTHRANEPLEHLGSMIVFDGDPDRQMEADKQHVSDVFARTLGRIKGSEWRIGQKLEAVRSSLHGKLEYLFKHVTLPLGVLDKMAKETHRAVKEWLGISNATAGYINAKRSDGGVGIPSIHMHLSAATISYVSRLNESKDRLVRQLLEDTRERARASLLVQRPPQSPEPLTQAPVPATTLPRPPPIPQPRPPDEPGPAPSGERDSAERRETSPPIQLPTRRSTSRSRSRSARLLYKCPEPRTADVLGIEFDEKEEMLQGGVPVAHAKIAANKMLLYFAACRRSNISVMQGDSSDQVQLRTATKSITARDARTVAKEDAYARAKRSWAATKEQGKSVGITTDEHPASAAISHAYLSVWSGMDDTFVRNVAQARLHDLRTQMYYHRFNSAVDGKCPFCGDKEYQAHLLGGCPDSRSTGVFVKRHNDVVDALAETITSVLGQNGTTTRMEDHRNIKSAEQQLKHLIKDGDLRGITHYLPDLIVQRDGRIAIIDVRVTNDHMSKVQEVQDEKIKKYEEMASRLHDKTGKEVLIIPIILTSSGQISPQGYRQLEDWLKRGEPRIRQMEIKSKLHTVMSKISRQVQEQMIRILQRSRNAKSQGRTSSAARGPQH